MKSTVTEKWLTPNGSLPTGFWPQNELVRFIPQDIHDAAIAAARAEGVREGMLKAADQLERSLFWAPLLPDDESKAWVDGSRVTVTTAVAAIRVGASTGEIA